jgi:CelD/BcsL family acetyltransferase involved in cellulose biosynthesis
VTGGLQGTVVSGEEIAGIAGEWSSLAERCGNAFVSAEWHGAWLEIADGQAPCVVAVRDRDGALAGVLGLVTSGRRSIARFPASAWGDLFGPACEPGHEAEVSAAAVTALRALEDPPGAIILDRIELEPAALDAADGLKVLAARRAELPVVSLAAGSWEDYVGGLSAKLRKRIRYTERSLSKGRSVGVREVSAAAELDPALETLFDLHDRRWAERGGSSLADPAARRFHSLFARSALERGWLRLRLLEVDGVAVSALYGWRLGDSYVFYQGGFDPEWSRSSVGMVLLVDTIRAAIAEGASEFNMLVGDEPYKLRFADGSRVVRSLTLVGRHDRHRIPVSIEHGVRRAGEALNLRKVLPPRLARAIGRRMPSRG